MSSISYEGHLHALQQDESVLDGLLRNGFKVAHSCKAGSCGSCLMRAVRGSVPARAQAGLKESWKSRGYFLACVCHPHGDLEVTGVDGDAQFGATITALNLLSEDVLQVRLICDGPIDFRAGQFVAIVREGGTARSYSIASLPEDGELELHVRRVAGGNMSGWFHDEARIGQRVSVLGPSGECFYVPGREEQPLILVGTGTGLAPLYGIIRDALKNGHRGPIHLFHGALHKGGLYLIDELRRLAHQHSHVEYTPAVLNGEQAEGIEVGALDQIVLKRFPELAGWRGFVCGDPVLVRALKKKLFLSGMASRDIYADAFVPAAQTP
jgi:CDP-4-dehydro-6-deoxyglucose reductase, E3